jgi:hypothetical protein
VKRPAIVCLASALSFLLWPQGTSAQVPTASFDDDEDVTSPSASPRPVNQQQSTDANPSERANDSADLALRAPADVTPAASAAPPDPSPHSPAGLAALEERTIRMSSAARPGYARLSLYVSEPGSTVFVTQRQNEFDDRQFASVLARCDARCAIELPLGSYTVWVKASDDTRSSRDFELRSSRWMSVAPAHQVMRDFGFVAGAVGSVATLLGIGILSEVVCQTCTSTGRNITGGLAFGLGLPMGAVGWSLYFIHREARITDHILTQAERSGAAVAASSMASGAVLQKSFSF